MVLSRIFVPMRDEVTGQWMMWYNGELHNLYSSQYNVRQIKSRRMSWAGHVARMGEEKSVEGFVGNPEGKRQLEKSRHIW
jgi:hypothetical protein